jgi:hypothetical protein
VKAIKKTREYTIYKKGSGRHAVKNAKKAFVHGEEKTQILLAEGLIKRAEAQPKSEAPAEGGEASTGE